MATGARLPRRGNFRARGYVPRTGAQVPCGFAGGARPNAAREEQRAPPPGKPGAACPRGAPLWSRSSSPKRKVRSGHRSSTRSPHSTGASPSRRASFSNPSRPGGTAPIPTCSPSRSSACQSRRLRLRDPIRRTRWQGLLRLLEDAWSFPSRAALLHQIPYHRRPCTGPAGDGRLTRRLPDNRDVGSKMPPYTGAGDGMSILWPRERR